MNYYVTNYFCSRNYTPKTITEDVKMSTLTPLGPRFELLALKLTRAY